MALKLAVLGGCGLAFLGYCIYFDRKRRTAPDFKKKLREKRKQIKEENAKSEAKAKHAKAGDAASAAQEFFLNEVQLGEEALASGDMEGCVEHLLAALKVAGNPTQLLQMYQQALPPDVFQMLVQRLPTVVSTKSSGQGAQLQDDDLD
ncbi:mitochondrial import receptor subunit TOM20 homolog [Corticium candelabrum]|uniref:mitochondrial import receptor subunit TOM20 homolog n=1 Tax=Corticium candelabrum TaxID=121492 RepID=UPI002E269F9D|nr:mitochondrial import receptor subunit TOM20 homolog [Corticium candelabrum]